MKIYNLFIQKYLSYLLILVLTVISLIVTYKSQIRYTKDLHESQQNLVRNYKIGQIKTIGYLFQKKLIGVHKMLKNINYSKDYSQINLTYKYGFERDYLDEIYIFNQGKNLELSKIYSTELKEIDEFKQRRPQIFKIIQKQTKNLIVNKETMLTDIETGYISIIPFDGVTGFNQALLYYVPRYNKKNEIVTWVIALIGEHTLYKLFKETLDNDNSNLSFSILGNDTEILTILEGISDDIMESMPIQELEITLDINHFSNSKNQVLVGLPLKELKIQDIWIFMAKYDERMILDNLRINKTNFYKKILYDGNLNYLGICTLGLLLMVVVYNFHKHEENDRNIRHIAYHDTLTKLPNRSYLNNYLNLKMETTINHSKKLAFLLMDLDNFKNVNDTLGHFIGDELLKLVSCRLQGGVRENDVVFRLGGDEFVIILSDIDKDIQIDQITRKILNIFIEPFIINKNKIYTSPSIGVSIFPDDSISYEQMIKNADMAMYEAKNSGKNNVVIYDQTMNMKILEKESIGNRLKEALQENKFILEYQPQINIKTKELIGVEALLRLTDDKGNKILPEKFIPIAEEIGIINQLGRWVLETACEQNKEWQDMGYSKIKMSINLSARQFFHISLCDTVKNALKISKLEPRYLDLEITESEIMVDTMKAIELLNELRNMGVSVSLDDFGTGYSSLSYLTQLPIDILKIDKSFIMQLTTKENLAITKTIIAMAMTMGLKVVAEGVETEEQLSILKKLNCDMIQGFYFSKPMSKDNTEDIFNPKNSLL